MNHLSAFRIENIHQSFSTSFTLLRFFIQLNVELSNTYQDRVDPNVSANLLSMLIYLAHASAPDLNDQSPTERGRNIGEYD